MVGGHGQTRTRHQTSTQPHPRGESTPEVDAQAARRTATPHTDTKTTPPTARRTAPHRSVAHGLARIHRLLALPAARRPRDCAGARLAPRHHAARLPPERQRVRRRHPHEPPGGRQGVRRALPAAIREQARATLLALVRPCHAAGWRGSRGACPSHQHSVSTISGRPQPHLCVRPVRRRRHGGGPGIEPPGTHRCNRPAFQPRIRCRPQPDWRIAGDAPCWNAAPRYHPCRPCRPS
jgi:hypothetical protein